MKNTIHPQILDFVKMKVFFSKIFGNGMKKELIEDFCSTANYCFHEIEQDKKYDGPIWRHYTHLRNIKVKVTKNKIIYYITIFRPGIFIGPKGDYINLIQNTLKRMNDKEIEINIKEWKDPWLGWY